MGEKVRPPKQEKVKGYWSYYAVHSLVDGILKDIYIDPEVEQRCVIENHLVKSPGDKVRAFTGANTALGCLLMQFADMKEMLQMMDCPEKWIRVSVI